MDNPSTTPVPQDANTTFPPGAGQAQGDFTMWGGELKDAVYVAPTPPIGVDTAGIVTRDIKITFEAQGPTVVLAWGGHIASALDWGPDSVYTSEHSGAPFHMFLAGPVCDITVPGGSCSNQGKKSLSMHAAALDPAPGLTTQLTPTTPITTQQTVVDTATLTAVSGQGPVTGSVQFFVCGPQPPAPTADCLTGGTRVGGPQVVALSPPPNGPSGQATIAFPQPGEGPIDPGNHCFRAEYTPSATANYSPAVHPTTHDAAECFDVVLPPPELTITKLCVPVTDPGLFDLLLDGNPLSPNATDVPCGQSRGPVDTTEGTHTVSESVTTSGTYTSTIGGDCAADGSITLANGDSKTCTITNVRTGIPTGSLTVEKVCDPPDDNGQFVIQVDGHPVAQLGCGDTTDPIVLGPGDHTVSESSGARTSRADYTTAISGDCAADGRVTIVTGETKACTITNTRIPPTTTLTVRKVCFPVGDDGRFKVGIFTVTGRPVHRVVLTCHGTTGAVKVHPGTYVVRERGADGTDLSDYNRFVGGDCLSNGTVTLQAGDHARCRIANVHKGPGPQPAELTVTKICVPADDGGRFNLAVDGQTLADAACGDSFGPVAVVAGEHHVTESAGTGTSLSDYTTTIGGACAADGTVTLVAGQQATCTITNVYTGTSPPEPPDATGTVEVQKRCLPAGTTGKFQLEIDQNIFHLACGESTGPVVIPVGEHRVGEVAVSLVTSRFTTTIGGDCAPSGSFTLSAGEHVTCVVTNTLVALEPPLEPPSACYTLSATPRTVTAGKRVRVVARVHLARTPIAGVRVYLTGPRVSAVRTTSRTGWARFSLTPSRRGVLRVSIRKAFDCPKRPPKKIGIVGAATPPVTG